MSSMDTTERETELRKAERRRYAAFDDPEHPDYRECDGCGIPTGGRYRNVCSRCEQDAAKELEIVNRYG